jgi:hypothetical protein
MTNPVGPTNGPNFCKPSKTSPNVIFPGGFHPDE